MVSNIYFALKKMVVAVWTGLIAVAVNIGLSLWLIHPLEHKGLALANSLLALVNLCLLTAGLFVVLRQQGIQANPLQGIGKFLGQVIIAVTGMSVLVSEYLQYIGPQFSGKSGLMVVVFSAVLLGAVAYAIFAYLLRIEEVRKGAAFALRKVRSFMLKRGQ
ncbi:MAG: lipid II flippase MurJ [Clostridiaceae bacterium]